MRGGRLAEGKPPVRAAQKARWARRGKAVALQRSRAPGAFTKYNQVSRRIDDETGNWPPEPIGYADWLQPGATHTKNVTLLLARFTATSNGCAASYCSEPGRPGVPTDTVSWPHQAAGGVVPARVRVPSFERWRDQTECPRCAVCTITAARRPRHASGSGTWRRGQRTGRRATQQSWATDAGREQRRALPGPWRSGWGL